MGVNQFEILFWEMKEFLEFYATFVFKEKG